MHVIISLFLVIITAAVYWPVGGFEFIRYDDPAYVSENSNIKTGFTIKGILWAFSTFHACNWHPITWISHMADIQLYGINPGPHHLINLVFHILNTTLLFHVFRKMTKALWQSAFVAVLFAVHPLHVESVAWIAERKDVLSTFFWLLTMLGYISYSMRRGVKMYLVVLLFFILGLMTKPMLVTLPIILLLMDYWPLKQFNFENTSNVLTAQFWSKNWHLILEKVPLVILSVVSSFVTIAAQSAGDAIQTLYHFPIAARIANSLVSYVKYIAKMIWPFKLAFLYPYPRNIPIWQTLGAFLFLVWISKWVFKYSRQYPYLVLGWAWYLVTLVPVIGLVQVGVQGMADRYTYIPTIGLTIIISWGVPELMAEWRNRRLLIACSITAIIFLMVRTTTQIQYWRNSRALFSHSLSVTDNNYQVHLDIADAFLEQGMLENAIVHYRNALQILPDFAEAHNNLGVTLFHKGEIEEAIKHYREALRILPKHPKAQNNLGTALIYRGKVDEAIKHYTKSLLINPDNPETHNNIGLALLRQGKIDRAVRHFKEAIQIDPESLSALNNFKRSAFLLQQIDEALSNLEAALQMDPATTDILNHKHVLEHRKQELNIVLTRYQTALTPQPNFSIAEMSIKNYPRAFQVLEEYDRLFPLYQQISDYNPGSAKTVYYFSLINSVRRQYDASKK